MNKDELSHVKRQMNKDSYCTSTDLEDYFFGMLLFFNTGCGIFYAPRPANHSGWLATIAGFFKFFLLFIYLFIKHCTQKEKSSRKGNVPRIPSEEMQGFR